MHGFPIWFGLLLHPLTWALLVALVLAVVVCVVHLGWRRALFYALLIFPFSFFCAWDATSRARWLKWWRNGGL
jgi:hypothetical protein